MPTRRKRKYKLIKIENETTEENENRQYQRDTLIKLVLIVDQERIRNQPDQTLIGLLNQLINKLKEKSQIEISETQHETRASGRFGETSMPRGPNKKLREIHEEIKYIKPALREESRKYEADEKYREQLNQTLGINR
jgi:hypothetical protein